MGYIGDREATAIILEGLRKQEYRGCDSSGISIIKNGKIFALRKIGEVSELVKRVKEENFTGEFGIGHTRWSTHGDITENNTHPHISSDNKVVLVHNGVIENAREVRAVLEAKGIEFHSETDTESAVQYLASVYDGNPKEAIVKLTKRICGAFAIVIMFSDKKDEIWVVRKGSPIVIGHTGKEGFCASDPTALLEFTNDVWFMDDNEMALINRECCKFFDFEGVEHSKQIMQLDWDVANRGKFAHYMLKEIHEQPRAIAQTLLGRIGNNKVDLSKELDWTTEQAKNWKKIHFVACGTSHYATASAALIMETFGPFEIRTEIASEYCYRNFPIGSDTLVIFVTQSGETADTLQAVRFAKSKGAKCLVITNVRNSTIHLEVGDALITPAGPEIGVAATKSYTTQLTMLTLLGMYIAKLRGVLTGKTEARLIKGLMEMPPKLTILLNQEENIREIARNFLDSKGFFFMAKNLAYPPALEGALKLKEISYLFSEAYPAGEIKHGPMALLNKDLPIVALVPKNILWERTISNIKDYAARNSPIIAVATAGDKEISKYTKNIIYTPETEPELFSFIAAIPLQLFAYFIARQHGYDIDSPRNLSKSVTD